MSISKAELLVKLVLLGIIVSIAACGGKRDWYNYRCPGVAFEQDLKTCKNRAENSAAAHSLFGDDIVLATYNADLLQCLYSKGWTHVSPETRSRLQGNFSARVRFVGQENKIIAFGERIDLKPDKFRLLHKNSSVYGPGYLKRINFKGPESVYLNFVFQKNLTREFENTGFNVDAPFVQYSSGSERSGSKQFNWSVYFGEFKGEWIMGLGCYILLTPRKRISIIVTRNLIEPQREPEYPLRLTREQHTEIGEFPEKWLGAVRSKFGFDME